MKIRTFTEAEFKRLLSVCLYDWRDLIYTSLYTSLPLSTAAELRWSDANMVQLQFQVKGKSIPMARPVLQLLKQRERNHKLRAKNRPSNLGKFIFPDAVESHRRGAIYRQFSGLIKKAGLSDQLTAQSLRGAWTAMFKERHKVKSV